MTFPFEILQKMDFPSFPLATVCKIGDKPSGSGEFGSFFDKGPKILITSVYPLIAADWIGVHPDGSGALGILAKGVKTLTIFSCP